MLRRMQDARVAVQCRREDRYPVALQPARLALPDLQRGAHCFPSQRPTLLTCDGVLVKERSACSSLRCGGQRCPSL